MRRQIKEINPNYIIHFGALPLANMAIENSEEAFDTLLGGTVNLLEILRDLKNLKRFVYISSSMIYGNFEYTPIDEESKKEPVEIYGGMKLAGEYMVKVYSKRYDIPYTIIRPSAVYGPTDNNKRVVDLFLTNAILNKKIKVNNAKTTYLDFTYVKDLVEGIKLATLSDKAKNEDFNITRGKGKSLQELIDIILKLYPNTEIEYTSREGFRPKRGSLSIKKAEGLLSYKPKFDLNSGVEKYSNFLNHLLKNIKVQNK